ncbi:MAG: DUF523 domain-containing protein [Parasporobacterium sp.]|nr:DUF523 domain-containing protein [Parasporobacterium sp.]
MKILASACLMGENCKYNGGNNYCGELVNFAQEQKAQVLTVCPEVLGGLPTPRIPSEIVSGKVTNREHICVDEEFRRGAEAALKMAEDFGPDLIVLQARSPSCGCRQIYDGSFSGKLIPGMGVFAKLLTENGFDVTDSEEFDIMVSGSARI